MARVRLPVLEKLLGEMFAENVIDTVAADPYNHRKTQYVEPSKGGRRYREYVNGKGQRVRFYRSTGRNIAGYYLIWRETTLKNGTIKNDMLRAFKSRTKAKQANDIRFRKATAK